MITRAMAETLYPDDPDGALGKTVYINDDEPITVTGIIEQMQAPWNGWSGLERVMLVPHAYPVWKHLLHHPRRTRNAGRTDAAG